MSTSPIAADRALIASMRATLLADQLENASSKSAPGSIVDTLKGKPIGDADRVEDPWADRPPTHTSAEHARGAQAALRGRVTVAGQRPPQLTPQQRLRREIEKSSSDVADPYARPAGPARPAPPRHNPPSGL